MVFEYLVQYQTPFTKLVLEMVLVFCLAGFVGLERGALKFRKAEAGIRTFSLIGLLGYFSLIGESMTLVPLTLISLIGLISLESISHYLRSKNGHVGITTEISIFLTFFLGVLVALGVYWYAIMLSIVMTAILVSKRLLFGFTKSVSQKDILSTIKFLIISVIIFPLLPNEYVDPWNLFNPANVWFIVVMVSGVSFAGFLSVKVYGENKGIKLTGLFGGLANSEATVASLAQRFKAIGSKAHGSVKDFVASAMLSNTSALVRNLLIAFISGGFLILEGLWWPILVLVGVNLLGTLTESLKKQKIKKQKIDLKTPFAVKPAFKFGLFFLLVSLFVTISKMYLGEAGLLIVTIIASLVSSGAVVASISSSAAGGTLTADTAVIMILISCVVSNLNKLTISKVMGGDVFFKEMLKPILLSTAVGIILIILNIFAF